MTNSKKVKGLGYHVKLSPKGDTLPAISRDLGALEKRVEGLATRLKDAETDIERLKELVEGKERNDL